MPTPAGQAIPQFDFQLSLLNTVPSGRLLADSWTEAMLLIDEPRPGHQRICGTPGDNETSPGICSITGTGGTSGIYDGTPGRPNIFQGHQVANSLSWAQVPVDSPPVGSARIIRLTNIRMNTSLVPPDPSGITLVNGLLSAPGITIVNPDLVLAFVSNDFVFSQIGQPFFQQCVSENPNLAHNSASSGSEQFSIRFREGFATSFKTRTAAPFIDANTSPVPVDQDEPFFLDLQGETGFFSNSFPLLPGRGNLALAGLADSGTRLMARFSNVPAGVRLFAPAVIDFTTTSSSSPFRSPGTARLVNTDVNGSGAFSPIPGNSNGLAPIAVSNGAATAVYEILGADPNAVQKFNVPIYVAYDATTGVPAQGTASLRLSAAPLSTAAGADPSAPIPRFADTAVATTAFSILPCACASNMSAQIGVTRGGFVFNFATGRFLQRVTLVNSGPDPIAGPVSLVLDSLSSNTTLINRAGATSCAAPAGAAYVNVDAGSSGVLNPGDTASVTLQFTRPASGGITYNTRVLAGGGGR